MNGTMTNPLPGQARALLDVWFGAPGTPEFNQSRKEWFKVDPAFDAVLRERFLDDQKRAAKGDHDDWLDTADGSVALALLLDQLPRNLYRGTAEAFASDAKALAVARAALAREFDRHLPDVRRWFLYLPFEHSEDLADQDTSVILFEGLPESSTKAMVVDYAVRHRDIIRRFGRFSHRNAILGRVSTTEETEFLKQPNSSF